MERFWIPFTGESMPSSQREEVAKFIAEHLGINVTVESEYFVIDAKDANDSHTAKRVIWGTNASYMQGRLSMRPKAPEKGEFPIVA